MTKEIITRGLHFFGKQRRPFKINMLRASFQNFLFTLVVYYQSLYIIALGATPFQLGLAIGIGGIAGVGVAIPGGWLADRYGVRTIFLCGTLVMAMGAATLAFASHWEAAIPGLVLSTLGFSLLYTICPLVCGSCLENQERATGMQMCDAISAVPRLVAPLMGAVLVTAFGGISVGGIRPLYYVQFLGFSLISLFIFRLFSDPIEIGHSQNRLRLLNDMNEVFRSGRTVKRFILYNSLSSFAYFIALQAGFVALYANMIKHADQYTLGIMASTLMIVPITLSILVGRLADIFGRRTILFVTIPIYCLSLILLILAKNSTTLILSSILQGFLLLNLTTEGTISVELVPVSLLGRWMGILTLTRGVVGIIAPIVAGVLWSLIGASSLFILIVCVELMLIPLLAMMPETLIHG